MADIRTITPVKNARLILISRLVWDLKGYNVPLNSSKRYCELIIKFLECDATKAAIS